ncbi:hypothetical protein Q4Q49_21650 [Shewanella sp. SP1S1-7]|jgi:hypothetical protein|uniref:DUF3995 domain-containing protein n=1 Tax=Shewanella scandinavica TaxID=3063538 RepID=A0ABU3G5N5_9GAMM|nr:MULTISPECIES: hypothetical protein [unclassified Shewanella]MBS0042889.1 hypothetical protein [Shewanella sp. M16]MDT3282954.1 hypothetical protein [Shewanella sp. SP2S1-2]MDT3321204.1 hypothetical protein [Shewanella sp. SP1S2-4]MDT3337876.1 hypothetical protein [Shewanella sp. SP1S1-7]
MNVFLIIAGALSAVVAILHIGCIYFGAPWYRFFGAGEQMALLAERGSIQPTLITSGIVLVLSIWSIYAFSAAGVIVRLPLLRLALILITFIYLLRGVAGFFLVSSPMGRSPEFWMWSSLICLSFGIIHFIGLKQQWSNL